MGSVRKRYLPRPPGCSCPSTVLCDKRGNVLELRTCPACTQVALDVLRGGEYACAYVKGEDTSKRVLLKQKEFFSLQSMYSPCIEQKARRAR